MKKALKIQSNLNLYNKSNINKINIKLIFIKSVF